MIFPKSLLRSSLPALLLAAGVLSLALGAPAQSMHSYRGDPTILEPASGIAPPGYVHTNVLVKVTKSNGIRPSSSSVSPPFTPANVRLAYGVPATGGGYAIAIVDAYDYPTALSDFNEFASNYSLPQETSSDVTSSTNQVFQVVYAGGSKPAAAGNSGWDVEEALDIEWTHAMAPNAKIYLVEANGPDNGSMYSAVRVAAALANVKEVSNSWGEDEYSGESSTDSFFVQSGVVFFVSSGDQSVQEYPSESVNVVSVGGTSLNMTTAGYSSETGWSGSGGGPSAYETVPAFQSIVSGLLGGARGDPDCSAVADPNTGVSFYNSYSQAGWGQVGGTSLACPVVAGITNSREYQLNNFATSSLEEEARIYNNLMGFYYRDVTSGTSGSESCAVGYDMVTGIGSPNGLLPAWQGPGGNVQDTGVGLGSGAISEERWQLTDAIAWGSSEVVGPNNAVYFAANTTLYAVDGTTGNQLWSWQSSSAIGSPVLGPDGSLFFESGASLYSLDSSTGSQNWSSNLSLSGNGTPALGSSDTVYVASGGGLVLAVNGMTGTSIWTQTISGQTFSSAPVVGPGGTIYVLSESGNLYALAQSTGSVNWSYSMPAASNGGLAIGPVGLIYCTDLSRDVIAVTMSTGVKAWQEEAGNAIYGAPAVANGSVYVGDGSGTVFAYNESTGAAQWSTTVGGSIESSIAVDSAGNVYAGSSNDSLYSFNGSSGVLNWNYNTGAGITSNPAIGADGTVYIGNSAAMFAIGTSLFQSLSLSSNSVVAGTSVNATLTLTSNVVPSTLVFALSSGSAASIPTSLTIDQGSNSGQFTVNTNNVTTSTVVTITASLNGGSTQATLTVNPFFASFSAAPSTVVGGQGTTMTLDLTANVVSNTTATFSSTSNAVTVPASLQISSGQSSATSWITSTPVSQATTATITATVGGFTTTTTVTVNPAPVLSVTLNSNSLTGGSGTMGTVTLGAAAGPSGDVVTLVGGNTAVSIPSSVNIQSGATTGNFSVSTSAVSGTVNVTISAALGSSVKATTLTLNPAEVSAFSLSSNTVVGGSTVYGNVVLTSAAGASGDEVQLSSGNSAVTLPSAVLVPAGQTSVGFKVNSSAVASATPVNLTATFGGSFQLTTLTVNPAVSSLTLNQNSLNGGAGTTGTVTLAVQATGPEVVSLKSGNSAVSVTPSVTVGAGSSSAQFSVSTSAVGATVNVTISALLGGSSQTTTLTVHPATILSVTALKTTLVGGTSTTGTITLSGNAGASGDSIVLSSGGSAVIVPTGVLVGAGKTTVTFTIKTLAVSTSKQILVTATYGSSSKSVTITVNP